MSTRAMDPDVTATFSTQDSDGNATEQTPALTVEQTLFDEPLPIPPPAHGEPAYLVEVHAAHRPPSLLAIRATLEEAQAVAASVHPAFADVAIRELALPCNADSLAHSTARVWTRTPDGAWLRPCA